MDYLVSPNLLSSYQFCYRSKRSTELATAYFTDKIRQAMDNGEFTGAIYVDLSKAFDTISHGTIISKLPQFEITGTCEQRYLVVTTSSLLWSPTGINSWSLIVPADIQWRHKKYIYRQNINVC